ncbi:MAG: YciI family protein [Actinomycetota bacterium]
MQFVVIGRDGSDPEAPARRQAVRPTHLDELQPLVDAGNILLGGAILDDDGTMRGSVMLVDFPSREELDAWLDHDPYVTDGVWQQVEVAPFRVAVGSWIPETT